MPTYRYVCEGCAYAFEEFQPITAKAIRKCPKCKKAKIRRVISGGAAVLFKGSGFYQTDYRSKSYREAEKKEKPEGKSETKNRDHEGRKF